MAGYFVHAPKSRTANGTLPDAQTTTQACCRVFKRLTCFFISLVVRDATFPSGAIFTTLHRL